MKRFILLLVVLFFLIETRAQSPDVEPSNNKFILSELDDSLSIECSIDSINYYLNIMPQKSIDFGNEVLRSDLLLSKLQRCIIYNKLILCHHSLNSKSEVEHYLLLMQELIENTDDSELEISLLNNYLDALYKTEYAEEALNYLMVLLDNFDKNEYSETFKGNVFNNVGSVFFERKRYQEALFYFKKALTFESSSNGFTLLNIGTIYSEKLNKLDSAQIFFNEAYTIFNENKTDYGITAVLIHKGEYQDSKGNYEKATDYYEKAEQIIKAKKYFEIKYTLQRALIKHYFLLKDYKKVIIYSEKYLTNNNNNDYNVYYVSKMLFESHAQLNNYEKAYTLLSKHYYVTDSLQNFKYNNTIQEFQMKLSFKEKEAENKLLRTSVQRRNIIVVASIIILILLSIIIIILRRSNDLKKSQNQKLATEVKEQSRELIEAHQEIAEIENIKLLEEAKSRFFANISHELRTPLTMIQVPLETILNNGELSDKSQARLSRAYDNSKRLQRLVDQVLDLTKMNSNKLELEESEVLFYPFIHKIIGTYESYANQRNIEVLLDYDLSKELFLQLDKDKFEKVVNNFISNAIKFTPKNGTITVKVSDLAYKLAIKVIDTGIGIPKSELEKVFDRFYQVKMEQQNTTTTQTLSYSGGTGIGLSMCKEYARLMDGNVRAESDEKGSTFFFEFPKKKVFKPLDDEALASIKQQETFLLSSTPILSKASKKHAKTLLIVEDNYDIRTFLIDLLEEEYIIITKENGQEALNWLTQSTKQPDLIISDVMMPLIDGFQLLEALKSNDKFRHIPVVMLTARADIKDKLKALRIGVDDYLLKPFNTTELKVRVKNLIINVHNRVIESSDFETENNTTQIIETTERDTIWLKELEEVVTKYLGELNLNAEFIASKMYISRVHLFRKVKSLTGLTYNNYLKEIRLQKARSLLEEKSISSVKEAAYSVGFKHKSHFSKIYFERFGKRPSEYF